MPFSLTVRLAADDGHQTPIRQAKATAYAVKQPVVLRSDGTQIVHQPETALTNDTGHATLTLYRSSEVLTPSDWAVTIDGVTWSGPVPETPDTAASILEMVESYGWGIIAAPKTAPVVAIAGPAGTDGNDGAPGPDIDGLSSDGSQGIDVVGNVAAASESLTGTDATHVVGTDQAAAGQTANIREVRDSTGQVLVKVDSHGNIVAVALTPPGAPTLGLATGGDITGTAYQWACTLVNAQGETTLGTKTLATALTDQQQSLTMPVSAPDGCTFNLYRNASAGSEWDQVTTGLAAGAVYVDGTLDVDLGSAAPTANTTAPTTGAFVPNWTKVDPTAYVTVSTGTSADLVTNEFIAGAPTPSWASFTSTNGTLLLDPGLYVLSVEFAGVVADANGYFGCNTTSFQGNVFSHELRRGNAAGGQNLAITVPVIAPILADDPLTFQLFNGTLGDITNAAVTVTVVKLA